MKNKRILLSLLIATVFLMPLMGNTAVADTTTYCFSEYDWLEAWETYPWNMADCDPDTYASTGIDGDVELLYGPITTGSSPGTITKVEIRAKGYYTGGQQGYIFLRPVFRLGDGDNHEFTLSKDLVNATWSEWFNITGDTNHPDPWTVDDVINLKVDVEAEIKEPAGPTCTVYCSIVELRVTST